MSGAFLRSPIKHDTKARVIDADNPHGRVVLLLDMDCFYAQCEVVRLGLDRTIPLALMQWNSALAVSYPARKFGIKRGDSFDVIREKSEGKCVTIHLPVTPVDETMSITSPLSKAKAKLEDGGNDKDKSSLSPQRDEQQQTSLNEDDSEEVDASQSAYDEEFNQPQDVREEMYRMEKNKMRSPTEGKACLDRYRLASSRIFSLIDETLAEKLGRKNFILERASIDELFIDVTEFCHQSMITDKANDSKDKEPDTSTQFRLQCDTDAIQSLKETVICHESTVDSCEKDDHIGRALRLGCHIALTVRRTVLEKLGFTLSAGISTNKLVSKLAASYGKPNGQAVVYPAAMVQIMEETQIRKARMLGGKLGKKVQALLPESETTMGSISRLLPLSQLEKAIGGETGRWVFDACRGIDFEEVKATLRVLPKSITAFKSFPKVSYPELEKWTALLARDIMKRVEMDDARNNRMPKSCTVGYTMVPGGAWIGRTFRLPFPTDKEFNARVQKLVDGTRKILTERGHSSFIRIGFSAIDFVVRPKVGIDSFFNKGKAQSQPSTKRLVGGNSDVKKESVHKSGGIDAFFATKKQQPTISRSIVTTSPQPSCPKAAISSPVSSQKGSSSPDVPPKKEIGTTALCKQPEDSVAVAKHYSMDASQHVRTKLTDEEIARQLQESYDKEANAQGSSSNLPSKSEKILDRDEAYALQLQSTYDREHSVLSQVERFSEKRKSKSSTKKGGNGKRSKIDFFLKK